MQWNRAIGIIEYMKNIFKLVAVSILSIFILSTPNTASAYSITPFATTGTNTHGITIDSSGNIYTTNYSSNNVSKITPAGVSTILGTTGNNPHGITIDSSGNIYTTNYSSNNVSKITPAGVSTILGTTGTNPYSITIDSSGNIYTANYNSNNVSKITPAGVSTILGTTGLVPIGITIDSSGNIYTANFNSNNVSKITPAGVSTILGTTGTNPLSITIDSSGNIYTGNHNSSNVSKITPAGVSTILGTTGGQPYGITIDPSGNIYTANYSSNNVSKITPAGVSTILGTTGTNPYSITIDSSGNIYTANSGSNNVSKITSPTLTEITAVPTPDTDTTPDYTFKSLSDATTTVTYGGACSAYAPVTTNILAGDNNNTITFQTMPLGTYSNCTIKITDGFGDSNTLTITPFTIVLAPTTPDMTAGTDSGVSNTDNITSDTTPDFTGSCTNGDTVELKVDGVAILPTATCAGGIYTITPATAISLGVHNITSTFTNISSAQSAALSFTIDNVGPMLSIMVNTTGAFTPETPQMVFSATDALSGVGHYEVTYFTSNGAGGGVGPATTINPATSPLSLVLDPDEMPHEVTIVAYDIAGNVTTITTRFVPVVTITAPTTILNTAINNTTFTVNSPTGNDIDGIALTGAAAAGATFSCTGFGGDITSPYANPVSCTVSNINTSGDLIVSARDSVNLAIGNNTQSYIIDTTAPAMSFLDNVSVGPTKSEGVNISVTDSNPNTGTYVYGFSNDATCNASDTFTTAFTSGTLFSITSEANNGKWICARATDLGGNISYLGSLNPLNIDVTPPTVTLSSTAVAPVIAPITVSITPSETVSDLTLSDITVVGGTASSLTGPVLGVYSVTITPTANGIMTITVPFGASPAGVLDVALNRQAVSSNTLSYQAYVAPSTSFIAPDMTALTDLGTSDTDDITSNTNPTFTGSCADGDTVTLKIDGVAILPTALCTGGMYTITPNTPVALGVHTISSFFSNPAGTSGDSPTLSFTIEAAPIVTPTGGGGGGGSAPIDQCPNDPGFQISVIQCSKTTTPETPIKPTTSTGKTYISPIDGTTQTCQPFNTYIKKGSKSNDKNQVKLWQAFLNKYSNESLVLDSTYGPKTEGAIKRFQVKYFDEILKPWNLTSPTGYTYQSTRAQGNKILGCSEGEVTLDNGVVLK